MNCRCFGLQCNIMSLSSLFLFISAMHFCRTFFLCVPSHTLLPLFTSLPRVFACRHTHTTTQDAHCSGFGCFLFSVCWWLPPPSVSVKGRRGEGARTTSHSCFWRDAPPMTALSRASNSIVGGMAGNVVAASWMDAESLLHAALLVIACSVCIGCGAVVVCRWSWD
ncbi:trans-sialidase [Trypanosoma cruzi]|nr:trans-sialidase [Trypanosoma cruzi]